MPSCAVSVCFILTTRKVIELPKAAAHACSSPSRSCLPPAKLASHAAISGLHGGGGPPSAGSATLSRAVSLSPTARLVTQPSAACCASNETRARSVPSASVLRSSTRTLVPARRGSSSVPRPSSSLLIASVRRAMQSSGGGGGGGGGSILARDAFFRRCLAREVAACSIAFFCCQSRNADIF